MSCAARTISTIIISTGVVVILATWGFAAITALSARRAELARDDLLARFVRRNASRLTLIPTTLTIIIVIACWLAALHAHPATTSTLVHTFMWLIALQGMAFIVQGIAGWVFVHGGNRLTLQHHVIIAFIYALASWVPVLILAIVAAFMTTPGAWLETYNIWHALLTPLTVPFMVIASAWGLVIGAALFMLIANITRHLTPLERDELENRALPALLIAAGAVPFIPLVYMGASSWNTAIPATLECGLVLGIAALGLIVIARFARHERLGFIGTLVTVLFAITATIATVLSLGSMNAPYTIRGYLYTNELALHDEPVLKRQGILTTATQIVPAGIDLMRTTSAQRGRWVYLANGYQCAPECAYARLAGLAQTIGKDEIRRALLTPEKLHLKIPPFMGTEYELDDLINYLITAREDNSL